MLPMKGIRKNDCVLMSHCPQLSRTINISHIFFTKFSPTSRHRLKYRLRHDDIMPGVPFPTNNALCESYRKDWKRTWVVVRNVFDAYITDRQGITLVTQLSWDRLAAFKQTLQHWEGNDGIAVQQVQLAHGLSCTKENPYVYSPYSSKLHSMLPKFPQYFRVKLSSHKI